MPIEMLKLHWKASKWLLAPFIVGAFAIPFMTWTGGPWSDMLSAGTTFDYFYLSQGFGVFYPFIAATAGVVLALTAWNWDHQKGHVYPLSLPISRMQYSVLKFGSGVLLLLLPTVTLFLTATGVTSLMDIPYGLHDYTVSLTSRFFIAGLTAYAFLFALASGTIRTTVYFLSGVGLFFFAGGPLQEYLGQFIPFFEGWTMTGEVVELLTSEYGPFRVFMGNWNLIDV